MTANRRCVVPKPRPSFLVLREPCPADVGPPPEGTSDGAQSVVNRNAVHTPLAQARVLPATIEYLRRSSLRKLELSWPR